MHIYSLDRKLLRWIFSSHPSAIYTKLCAQTFRRLFDFSQFLTAISHFQDIARYWRKIVNFPQPTPANRRLFWPKHMYTTPMEIHANLAWISIGVVYMCLGSKLEWRGYQVKKNDNIFIRFDTIQECDGRTDGRTDGGRHARWKIENIAMHEI